MKLIATKCPLCGSFEDYAVVYKNNFAESDISAGAFSARKLPDRIHYQIVRCNRDGLVRSNPVLDGPATDDLYKKSRFTYEEEAGNLADSYYSALKPVLRGLSKDAGILEVGCGNGFLLKRLYDTGYENVSGIEPSIAAAGKADGAVRQRIVVDMLKPGIFKAHTFHAICFFQTFEHIQDPDNFLKICYDLLLPGGSILAFSHDIESLQAKMLGENSPIIDIGHAYLYSRVTLRKIFEKNLFQPVSIYSPANVVSLRHLICLSPIPGMLKMKSLSIKTGILSLILKRRIRIKLGNICLIAKKALP
jgi:SAM-dependent methyltransferase